MNLNAYFTVYLKRDRQLEYIELSPPISRIYDMYSNITQCIASVHKELLELEVLFENGIVLFRLACSFQSEAFIYHLHLRTS